MTCGKGVVCFLRANNIYTVLCSCYELLGQLVQMLQSNLNLELIPDLLELDENLTVS